MISIFLSLLKGRPVVGDMVSPQIPLVLHLLLADLAGELPAHRVHVEDVLLQVELVAEHSLAVLAHPRLSALPRRSQQGRHLPKGNSQRYERTVNHQSKKINSNFFLKTTSVLLPVTGARGADAIAMTSMRLFASLLHFSHR